MLCEGGMTTAKATSALLIPQNTKQATPPKTQNNTRKTNKYCINCGMNSHNVETCKKKKEQTIVGAIEAAQQIQKPQNTSSYACQICGLNGHKMTDYPKFIEMQKMFHGKSMTIVKVQLVAKIKTIIIDVNVVDVNVITRSKATKEHVFKDKKLRKTKSVDDCEKEKRFKKSMVEIIQQIQKTQTQTKGPSTSMEGWNTTWPSMPNTTPIKAHKS
jgi:hypothetical protein